MSERRLKSCIANWPDCYEGGYDPSCCRFPKSCSCTIYSDGIDDDLLEPEPDIPAEPTSDTVPQRQMNGEDADRRMHWLRLARELGQEDDFRALMDDLRREGAGDAQRGTARSINASDYPRYRSTITGYLMDGRTVDLIEEYASRCANLQPHEVHYPDFKVGEGRPPVPVAGTYVCPGVARREAGRE